MDSEQNSILAWIKKWVLNRYTLTCLIFLFIFSFCGEQSFVKHAQRRRQINDLRAERDSYKKQKEKYETELKELNSSDENIERYAREHYLMHADNEQIFIVEEDE